MSLISKPLLAGLLVTLIASVLLVLQPETAETVSAAEDLLVVQPHEARALGGAELASWRRTLPAVPGGALQYGMAPPPPPPPPSPVPLVVAPPRPVAPAPGFRYLGRMVRDDTTYVFLGQGTGVEVVPVGGIAEGNWRIEGFSTAGLELRYLPLNETRQLALSER